LTSHREHTQLQGDVTVTSHSDYTHTVIRAVTMTYRDHHKVTRVGTGIPNIAHTRTHYV
jgi:hypothetical protein